MFPSQRHPTIPPREHWSRRGSKGGVMLLPRRSRCGSSCMYVCPVLCEGIPSDCRSCAVFCSVSLCSVLYCVAFCCVLFCFVLFFIFFHIPGIFLFHAFFFGPCVLILPNFLTRNRWCICCFFVPAVAFLFPRALFLSFFLSFFFFAALAAMAASKSSCSSRAAGCSRTS